MDKIAIVDNRLRSIEKEKLKEIGYTLVNIQENNKLYSEISSHVDIHLTKINDNIVIEKTAYDSLKKEEKEIFNKKLKNKIIISNELVSRKYPEDIKYNVCQIGKNVVHNFKYTNKQVINLIEKERYNKINVKQGYTKCSIAVIDENSVIVSDLKLKEILEKQNIDVLYIENKNNIKLLNNGNYSKMTGFIGGCISRIENNIFITGDLLKIDKDNKIRGFIEKRNLNIIDFKNLDVIDYGGIITIQ